MSDTSNDVELQKIPDGSVITEEMVEEVRELSKLTDENGLPCNRDVAIGDLLTFERGEGQPKTELFEKFPTLAAAYYNAIAARNASKEDATGELPSEPAASEEAPAGDQPSGDGSEA
jgi:hypothetical protein